MDNNNARRLAAVTYGATGIVEFTQEGSLCTAYVASWLRRRSRDKDFWGEGRFSREAGGTRRYGDKGAAVERAKLQMPSFLNSTKEERAYIESGSKHLTATLQHVTGYQGTVNAQNGESSLIAAFSELESDKMLASLSILMEKSAADSLPSHAIGVDCSRNGCAYFDPNLGELTFPSATKLGGWWFECFRDRKNTGTSTYSAFSRMVDGMFRIEIYERQAGA